METGLLLQEREHWKLSKSLESRRVYQVLVSKRTSQFSEIHLTEEENVWGQLMAAALDWTQHFA